MVGVCKMCNEERGLVESHLMPRLLYDYLRQGSHRPVFTTEDGLIPSDRQIKHPLLCEECEQILNDGGETWIAEKLAHYDKTFPLYQVLSAVSPLRVGQTLIYSAAKTQGIRVDKLVHFGMGIFWKAAIHSWKAGRQSPRIELGKYSEPLRTWLRGETPFPAHMYLVVCVAPPQVAQISMFPPYEARRHGWHVFFSYVPGLLFILNVGRTVDNGRKLLAHGTTLTTRSLIPKDSFRISRTRPRARFKNARKTQSFLRAMEKIAKERGE